MFKPEILYEDNDLLVINKPAGMVVNRAQSVKEQTVQDWVEKQSWWAKTPSALSRLSPLAGGDKIELFMNRSGIAHRLDKETSGCLLIAKNPLVLEKLLAEFKNRRVHKEYLALVHGKVDPREGTIRLPIGRDRFERKRRKVQVEGKVAQTRWRVEKYVGDLSLVRLWPQTGRTHQIRVHMSYLGHPLVSDSLYLNKKLKASDRAVLPRHFLHAVTLEFKHPVSGKSLRIESDLPADLQNILK